MSDRVAWLWWRARLAIGWCLKRLGCLVLDAGWGIVNRAAKDYRDAFQRFEP